MERSRIFIAVRRVVIVSVVVAMTAMWIYALAFSPRESINRVYDDRWSNDARVVCEAATARRTELADYRTLDDLGPEALATRAALIERANLILASMVSELDQLPRATEKARALLPKWLADWRTHLDDRAGYVSVLRSGSNRPFSETRVEGLPLSEKIATFAADNLVPGCSPPRDLSL